MAASLGLLGHEHEATCYAAASSYPPPAASSYCFFPPELVADGGAVMEFPPAAAMDDYFLPEIMGARAPDYYNSSPPAPVFANGAAAAENEMAVNMLSYMDDDGRRMVTSGSGGNNGGGGGRPSRRIGFRTRSELDVLDDGFKWRKYGKKAVKSSPNPRNYYRCSAEGCGVKKRVERDRDDPRYVVTTYDGIHNHAAPGSGGACLALPPRGVQTQQSVPPRPACSAAPWSAPGGAPCSDAWGMHTQLMHDATAAAHSSESSY